MPNNTAQFTDPLIKPSSAVFVPQEVPLFVQQNYPVFVEFMQAYFEWLDTVAPRNIETDLDVETSPQQFLSHFGKDLNYIAGQMKGLTPAQFIENARQMFLSKGTPASFSLLFQLLSLPAPEIRYPKDNIFQLSASQWQQEKSFFVDVGNTLTLAQLSAINTATIQYKGISIVVQIKSISLVSGTIYEFFLQPGNNIPFDAVYCPITFSGITGNFQILPTVLIASANQIFSGGQGFSVGQIFTITSPVLTPITLQINAVDSNGAILSLSAIRYGVLLSNNNAVLTLYPHPVQNQTAFNPFNDAMGQFSEYGIVLNSDYWIVDASNNYANEYGAFDYVGSYVTSFGSTGAQTLNQQDAAILSVIPAAMSVYRGYYSSNRSMLSDPSVVLQDGFLYQQFSYIISSLNEVSDYANVVLKYIHPAGTQMFTEYNIQTQQNFSLSPQITIN
jgi:hypothetical protein